MRKVFVRGLDDVPCITPAVLDLPCEKINGVMFHWHSECQCHMGSHTRNNRKAWRGGTLLCPNFLSYEKKWALARDEARLARLLMLDFEVTLLEDKVPHHPHSTLPDPPFPMECDDGSHFFSHQLEDLTQIEHMTVLAFSEMNGIDATTVPGLQEPEDGLDDMYLTPSPGINDDDEGDSVWG